MNRPRGLGKGLGAIFQEKNLAHKDDMPGAPPPDGSRVEVLHISQIQPNPFQPRKEFNQEELEDLAQSIREKGVFQPILVRRQNNSYQIIAGERRFRASQLAGKDSIPALIRDQVSDRDMREVALLENIQRVQLNAIEEALAYQELINSCGYTHEQLSDRLGKSRPAITNSLRLLKLTESVQAMISDSTLSAGHARVLASLPQAQQDPLAKKAIEEGWSVRTLELEAGLSKPSKPKSEKPKVEKKPSAEDPNQIAFVRDLEKRLGTRVHMEIQETGKGYLRMDFLSKEDLNRLADVLLGLDRI
ncbi:MAG: ParB/RepB/Spo0J family partition protein [Fibrobacteres bacterium]|jgi:ParB family chromosome partitioning protein|nr:ParB/RepB/Spo0J family partition protein [Fibrobacterota bacterium]